MRYRKISADGDYVFGAGVLDYLKDVPEAVSQACVSRLRLLEGEWFLDVSAGTPWQTQILGMHTAGTRDMTVYGTVLQTAGVTRIANFASVVNPNTREYSVSMVIDTIYGLAQLQAAVQ